MTGLAFNGSYGLPMAYQVSSDRPTVSHVRKFDNLDAVAQHRLAQAAQLDVGLVTSGRHEHLKVEWKRYVFREITVTPISRICVK